MEPPDKAAADAQVAEMCRKLLANPVIEDFRFEVEAAPVPRVVPPRRPPSLSC